MKFILVEDLNSETPEKEIKDLKDTVEVTLQEDTGYKQLYIDDSSKLKDSLVDFLNDFEDEPNKLDFLTEEDLTTLHNAIEILDRFHSSYSKFATIKANEFIQNNKGRGL